MKSLEKRPADRWQTAAELVQRLDALAPGVLAPPRPWTRMVTAAGVVIALTAIAVVALRRGSESEASWQHRWSNARIERLTDFPGSEVDAAISADGRLVAFLADRDSVFDAFVGQVGTGQFVNLTGGRLPQLFN